MSATVCVNGLTVVHKTSGGMVCFAPDVCLTPSPGGPVPIPYPNIAKSSDTSNGSKTVTMDGNPIMLEGSVFSTSTGDEAGSVGGVASGVTKGKARFINYSFDVKIEGKCVPRLGDQMLGNIGGSPNTPPMPEIQPPIVVLKDHYTEDDLEELTVLLVQQFSVKSKESQSCHISGGVFSKRVREDGLERASCEPEVCQGVLEQRDGLKLYRSSLSTIGLSREGSNVSSMKCL